MKRCLPVIVIAMLAVSMGQTGCPIPGISASLRPAPRVTVVSLQPDSLAVSFTVDLSAYPDATSINWSFGDGSTSTGLSPSSGRFVSHQFLRAGTFTVQVFVFRQQAVMGIGQTIVTVAGPNQPPVADFSVEDVSEGSGGTPARAKRFDASASTDRDGSIVSYAWDFGDQTGGATGVTTEHTYTVSGRFQVTLTVTDDRGATNSLTRTVVANIPPVASFTATPRGSSLPELVTVDFDASNSSDPDGSIVLRTWDFGDGTPTATGRTTVHTYSAPGFYDVSLTVTDNLGGTNTLTEEVDISGSEPFVTSITPAVGEVDTVVSITNLAGVNFAAGATVRLTRIGQTAINALNVDVASETQITCDFDLNNADLGDWDVEVRNPDGLTATLTGGFRVVTPDRVRLVTNMGDIVLSLDPAAAPNHVANFFQYVEERRYDNIVFHRVVPLFVIQGGAFISLGAGADPRLEEQEALPTINSEAPNGRSNVRGTVALALRGTDANSGSSQFFINLKDNPHLDTGPPRFTVFGEVVQGMDVVDAIGMVATARVNVRVVTGEITQFSDVPVNDVTILSARRE